MNAYETAKGISGSESEAREVLEALIDIRGLPAVVGLIAEVCQAKANHLRENWQDEGMARGWEQHAKVIDKAGFKLV